MSSMRTLAVVAAAAIGTASANTTLEAIKIGDVVIAPEALEVVDTKFGPEDAFPTVFDPVLGEDICSSGMYLGAGVGPTGLFQVIGEDDVDTLGPTPNNCGEQKYSYNAIGYNSDDHFLYAVTDYQNPGDEDHHVVRISRHGCVELVADIGPLDGVRNGKHIAGDIFRGTLWASSANKFRAIKLPVGTGPMTIIDWEFPQCTSMNDFAFAGTKFVEDNGIPEGTAFGFDIQTQQFCTFQDVSGGVGPPNPTLLGNLGVATQMGALAKVGGFFMDKDGAVYMYDNDANKLYKYSGLAAALSEGDDLFFEYAIDLGDTLSDANNVDGAACPQAPAPILTCPSLDKRCCPGYVGPQ